MQKVLAMPQYGYDAPEIVKRFGIYATLSLLITIALAMFLPSGWICVLGVLLMLFVTSEIRSRILAR